MLSYSGEGSLPMQALSKKVTDDGRASGSL
jgi:hypothetical protein